MNSSFAVTERKPLRAVFIPLAPTRLQRKCSCGTLGGTTACSCARHRPANPGQVPHNFGEIKVHADSPGRPAEGRVAEVSNADTGCDVTKGTPDITLHDPNPCYKDCTQRHEEVHRKDIAPCCAKANKAWESAKTEEKKSAVQDKMNDWVQANEFLLQCRAFAESVRCADEFLAAHCRGKKAEAGEGSRPQSSEGMRGTEIGDFPGDTLPPAPGPETAGPTALAEDKPADAPIDPQRCCYTVRDYRFHANAKGEAFCKAAKKSFTPCPF
jgi:hypothetical protein